MNSRKPAMVRCSRCLMEARQPHDIAIGKGFMPKNRHLPESTCQRILNLEILKNQFGCWWRITNGFFYSLVIF